MAKILQGRFAASPLMVGRDQELVQGLRLFALADYNAYVGYTDFPNNFGELVSQLFVSQREYVNKIASA